MTGHSDSRRRLSCIVAGSLAINWLCATIALSDDPKATKTRELEEDEKARGQIVSIAKQYRLFAGPDRIPLVMQEEPVIRWPNPTREVRDGATFIWTHDGRPEAIVCVWKMNRLDWFGFQSLSESPIVAERGGVPFWRPEKTDVTFHEFPGSPDPADTAAKRLVQMKDLMRRFSCRVISPDATKEELRLLPKPLYRYEPKDEKLLDGALFAFVQGTDPEVILSIEARRVDARATWNYGISRRSVLALEADLDDQPTWSVPRNPGSMTEPFFHGSLER